MRIFCLVVVVFLMGSFRSKASPDTSFAACEADKLAALSEEIVHLKVLFPNAIRYSWSVSGGKVRGNGSEAVWSLSGLMPGFYSATAKVNGRNAESSECSQLIVIKPDTRGPRVSGRTFLMRNGHEAEGYGLYSYLLFGSAPSEATRERYVQAVNAYLTQIFAVQDIEKSISRSHLNITYIPTVDSEGLSLTSDWILSHYDYARAAALLSSFSGGHLDGPYLVSVLEPLRPGEMVTAKYLFQDLSAVPPNLTSAWVKLFLSQAAQDKPWESSRTQRLALQMRTGIAVLAVGLPEVQKALTDWLAWKQ